MLEWQNKWNPFNSYKALVHVKYWESIKDGKIPPPLFLSIDPSGFCNLKCRHCNAAEVLSQNKAMMTTGLMDTVIQCGNMAGTMAYCIAGGGEPLMNKDLGHLLNGLVRGNKQVAVLTNGLLIPNHAAELLKCTYVGISVDAATNKTWKKVKGPATRTIEDVFKGISLLTGRGLEVTYKYLLLPDNAGEVYAACKRAKELGCNQFHLRPGSRPWFGGKKYIFTDAARTLVAGQLARAREELEDESFRIYSVTHKFKDDWSVLKSFKKCYACYTTAFVSPDGTMGLCCDRRGDDAVVLGNIRDFDGLWGGARHKEIQEKINVASCPRCTCTGINEIFENVIIKDKTLYNLF